MCEAEAQKSGARGFCSSVAPLLRFNGTRGDSGTLRDWMTLESGAAPLFVPGASGYCARVLTITDLYLCPSVCSAALLIADTANSQGESEVIYHRVEPELTTSSFRRKTPVSRNLPADQTL